MFSTALFISLLMSGVTLGHIALREILLQRENFLCRSQAEFHLGHPCYENEVMLSGVFFISCIFTKFCALPVGLAIDVWGPRLTTMLGCVIFTTGCILLAFSDFSLGVLHYAGYIVLAVGGMCVYFPSLVMGRVLPRMEGLTTAALTVSFDISAIVFYVMAWAVSPTRSISRIMGYYAIVPILALVLVTSFYPDGKLPPNTKRGSKKVERKFAPFLSRTDSTLGVYTNTNYNHTQQRLSFLSFCGRLLTSWEFWLLAIYTGAMTSRFVHFLSTLHLHLARLSLPWREQRALLTGYQTFLPLGGLISMTAAGQLLLSFSLAANTATAWLLINLCWFPLIGGRDSSYQAASYLLAAIIRPYYYAITNHLAERLFSPADLGRGYGLLMVMAGILNIGVVVDVYDGFPIISWWLVQAWYLVRLLSLASIALPIYLYYQKL